MHKARFCPRCAAPLAREQRDGYPRWLCSKACGFIFWNNPTPVVAAIVEREGCVILARNAAWTQDFYGLITGFLEAAEDPAEGVLREVQEELGLDGEVAQFVGHYPFAQMNQLIIAYHVRAQGEIRLNEELAAYKAIPIEKLQPWPYATGDAVRDWLAQRPR